VPQREGQGEEVTEQEKARVQGRVKVRDWDLVGQGRG